jgi:7-cyano-7-deazaguanine synthase
VKPTSIVLLSGGIDSAVCLGIATKAGDDVIALSFKYGQKHEKEIEAAMKLSSYFRAYHRVVELPRVFEGSGSALMVEDGTEMPQMSYTELQSTEGVSSAYVPNRNMVLLGIAGSVALAFGATKVYFGAHSEDAHNWAYPDCTPEFIGAAANALYVGTGHKVRLITPLQWLTKKDIVKLGYRIDVPFGFTWSCYNGREKACGKCPTCVSRIEAFNANLAIDPIPYEVEPDWH